MNETLLEKELPTSLLNNIEFTETPTITIAGKKVERLAFNSSMFCVFLLLIVLYYLGILKEIKHDIIMLIIFLCSILFFIFLVFNSSISKGSISFERERLNEVNQLNATFFGSLIIMFFVFNKYLDKQTTELFYFIIFVSVLLYLIVSVKNTGRSVALYRKPKQYIFNLIVILTCILIYKIGKNFDHNKSNLI